MRRYILFYIVTAASCIQHHALANTPLIIDPPFPITRSGFGNGVALDGNRMVVGALFDNTNASSAGRAFVMDANDGSLISILNHPSPSSVDFFGRRVALDGDIAGVGVSGDDDGGNGAGQAFLYDATDGSFLRALNHPTPDVGTAFGLSIAMDNGKVLVGSPGDDVVRENAGAAFLFDAQTGNLLHELRNVPGDVHSRNDFFGYSVDLSNGLALVGGVDNVNDSGSAVLFDADTGDILFRFASPSNSNRFAASVAVNSHYVVIGAPEENADRIDDSGEVFIFRTTTGEFLHSVIDPTPAVDERFGASVALDGSSLLIGSGFGSEAFLFDAETGNLIDEFNSDITPSGFGGALSIDGGLIAIGAAGEPSVNETPGSGRVYLYQQIPEPSSIILLLAALLLVIRSRSLRATRAL